MITILCTITMFLLPYVAYMFTGSPVYIRYLYTDMLISWPRSEIMSINRIYLFRITARCLAVVCSSTLCDQSVQFSNLRFINLLSFFLPWTPVWTFRTFCGIIPKLRVDCVFCLLLWIFHVVELLSNFAQQWRPSGELRVAILTMTTIRLTGQLNSYARNFPKKDSL